MRHQRAPARDGETGGWPSSQAPASLRRLDGGRLGGRGSSGYRHCFDLSRTRLISFEQRGCGRSLPRASDPSTSLERNTTAHLVRDIEALRRARGVDRRLVAAAAVAGGERAARGGVIDEADAGGDLFRGRGRPGRGSPA